MSESKTYSSDTFGLKRPYESSESQQNYQLSDDSGPSASKKPHLREEFQQKLENAPIEQQIICGNENTAYDDLTANYKKVAESMVFMIPIRANSKTEGDPVRIIYFNFPGKQTALHFTGSKSEGWRCDLKVNPTAIDARPQYLVGSAFHAKQRDGKIQACIDAVENLKKYCTLIEPNPQYFKDGGTPEFIQKRIPCNKNPRSYLLMTKQDTGHISPQVAEKLCQNFLKSSNEDMFFLDTEFKEKEKQKLMHQCQKLRLGFRHFGSKVELKDHHVCIYKIKNAQEIMEEASKPGWRHPKYLITPRF